MWNCDSESVSHSVVSNSLWPHGLSSPPGSSVNGILQASILEWAVILFSRESSWPRDQTQVSHIVGRFFTIWAIREALIFQFSHSVVSDSLRPHGLSHTRPPCPSPTPGVYSNSCSLSQWCHPAISSSAIPFSSCLQSFPASGSFPVSQFFSSGGQSIGASASASVLPVTIQDWFPLGSTGLISLLSKGLSRVFSNTTVRKHFELWHSAFFIVQHSHPYTTTEKTKALIRRTFDGKIISLLF